MAKQVENAEKYILSLKVPSKTVAEDSLFFFFSEKKCLPYK